MTMANAKEAPASPTPARKKFPRRCAKCAVPKPDAEFKAADGSQSPYCGGCRGRFPSLAAARVKIAVPIPSRKR